MSAKRRVRGFSLLEVLIASTILAFVMGAIYASLYSGTKEYEVNNKRAWAVQQARLALDEMSEDIRQSVRLTMTPTQTVPNAPAESAATNNVYFFKALPSSGGVAQKTSLRIGYQWVQSGATSVTDVGNSSAVYSSTTTPPSFAHALWVDANNNGVKDEGMLVKTDPNTYTTAPTAKAKVMCQYLKNDPDGFKVQQSNVTVNGERMLQVHITLTLIFTDSVNKVLEQTLESKVFVRNLQ